MDVSTFPLWKRRAAAVFAASADIVCLVFKSLLHAVQTAGTTFSEGMSEIRYAFHLVWDRPQEPGKQDNPEDLWNSN